MTHDDTRGNKPSPQRAANGAARLRRRAESQPAKIEGAQKAQVTMTAEEMANLEVIQRHFQMPSLAATIRLLIRNQAVALGIERVTEGEI